MIRFPCRCGHRFAEPDDAVGLSVQCPRCRLLNDVPRMSDLEAIAGDGTYKIDAHHGRPAPDNLDDTLLLFSRTKLDAAGEEIDLRSPAGEAREIGIVDSPDTPASPERLERPRYDPVTGELITPIPIVSTDSQPAQPAIPMATRIAYAGRALPRRMGRILLELTQPLNMLMLVFVFGFHLVAFGIVFATTIRFFLVTPFLIPVFVMLVAHYGNVVDEIGVVEEDELPRVFRDLRMHEDIWLPFIAIAASAVLCYGPAVAAALLLVPASLFPAAVLGAGLALAGTFLFPAVVLTLLSSGSISNLRPDRIAGVIRQTGGQYINSVIMLLIALILYSLALISVLVAALDWADISTSLPSWLNHLSIALPTLAVAIYAMHAFCWHLGLIYRAGSGHFPWVGRRHEGEPRPAVVRRKPRYLAPRTE